MCSNFGTLGDYTTFQGLSFLLKMTTPSTAMEAQQAKCTKLDRWRVQQIHRIGLLQMKPSKWGNRSAWGRCGHQFRHQLEFQEFIAALIPRYVQPTLHAALPAAESDADDVAMTEDVTDKEVEKVLTDFSQQIIDYVIKEPRSLADPLWMSEGDDISERCDFIGIFLCN